MLEKYFMFSFKGWHHLYSGIIILGVGLWQLSIGNGAWGTILTSIGFWAILDDTGQHRLQRVYNDANYHSYGHYIGKPLYQLRQWLIKKYGWEWLNKL